MKVRLLFADRDVDYAEVDDSTADLVRDLGLNSVLGAMGAGDRYLRDVAARVLLADPLTPGQVTHRQAVLRDCLRLPEDVRTLYQLSVEASEAKKRVRVWFMGDYPSAILGRAVGILRDLHTYLDYLHNYAVEHRGAFTSPGFTALMATVERELDEPYLRQVREHLRILEFPRGVVLTARLGPGFTGVGYSLRRPVPQPWYAQLFDPWASGHGYTYRLPPRDENGGRTLSRMRDHGINSVANAAAQSAEHVLDFFHRLRFELGFYIACVNLDDQLKARGVKTCLPTALPAADLALRCHDLVDAGLALRAREHVVGNDLNADGKSLLLLTGANQGGKSTLLRGVGLAQLMLNAGVFVTAGSYAGSTSTGLATHYRREEDAGLEHGKLDDELVRMSHMVDRLRPGTVVLLDESFASTNEREGSEIAHDIVASLLDAGMRVHYVTHLHSLAHRLAESADPAHLFLRAQRSPDGRRSFRLEPGPPEPTSHARDLYENVFAPAR
jgi:hypothetical protein